MVYVLKDPELFEAGIEVAGADAPGTGDFVDLYRYDSDDERRVAWRVVESVTHRVGLFPDGVGTPDATGLARVPVVQLRPLRDGERPPR